MRRSSILEVNLRFLIENFYHIKGLAAHNEILPMVKSDAYGHGLVEVSSTLINECKVSSLGVATLDEAIELKVKIPKARFQAIIFSDSNLEDERTWSVYEKNQIVPVIHRISDLDIFLSQSIFKSKPLFLKLNSGMNRLGINEEELSPYLDKLKLRGIDHLMTHFACSYQVIKNGDKTSRQFEKYVTFKMNLENYGIEVRDSSVSNSGAIEQGFGLSENTVRPGLMLYGPWSVKPTFWKGKQVSRLTAKVLRTFDEKKGTPLGYGINVLGEDSFVIIISLGYGDGFLTYMTGVEIEIKGYKGKVFGRVNMDMTYIVFNSEVSGKIKENEIVEIWNENNETIPNIANQMKTNSYQIMTGITSRVPRIYLGE